MHDEIEILLEQFSERIGCFRGLLVDCKNSIVKTLDYFFFANTKKARRRTEQLLSLVENRPTKRIGITIDIIVGRTFQMVTIVQLQSLRSNSREFGGVSRGFYCPSRVTIRLLFVRIQ